MLADLALRFRSKNIHEAVSEHNPTLVLRFNLFFGAYSYVLSRKLLCLSTARMCAWSQ
jgi:hypothetical protein